MIVVGFSGCFRKHFSGFIFRSGAAVADGAGVWGVGGWRVVCVIYYPSIQPGVFRWVRNAAPPCLIVPRLQVQIWSSFTRTTVSTNVYLSWIKTDPSIRMKLLSVVVWLQSTGSLRTNRREEGQRKQKEGKNSLSEVGLMKMD